MNALYTLKVEFSQILKLIFLQMDILDGRDVIVDFDDIYGRPGNIQLHWGTE